jgi:hypothetical protein
VINFKICDGIRTVGNSYKDLFWGKLTKYRVYCALFYYYLFGMNSLSQLVRDCPWSPSVSELSRAIKDFKSNRLMRRLRGSILRRFKGKLNPDDFCFALDDTANPKYGKNTFCGGYWRGSEGIMYGQKIVLLALVDIRNNVAYPLAYTFAIKKTETDYKKIPLLAVDLLKTVLADGFPKLPLTLDSWFDGVEFINAVKETGVSLVGQFKSNRNVKTGISPTATWMNITDFFRNLSRIRISAKPSSSNMGEEKYKWYSECNIYIKKYPSRLITIAVYNRKNGHDAFGFYFSNDLSLTGAQLWKYCRARWRIECLFRDLKQNLSFGKLPCQGESAANLAVCFPLILYVSLNLDHQKTWGFKSLGSTGSVVRRIMQRDWRRSVDEISKNPDSELMIKYRSRNHHTRLTKKPTDGLVEEKITLKKVVGL